MVSIVSSGEMRGQQATRDEGAQGLTKYYRVVSNIVNETPYTVSTASGVPRMWSALGGGPFIVIRKTVTREPQQPKIWMVEVEYGLPALEEQTSEGTQQDDPTLEAPQCRVWYENEERTQDFAWQWNAGAMAWQKRPFRNAAHMRFPEPYTGSLPIPIVEFQHNIDGDTDVIDRMFTFADSYCEDDVFGVDADTRRARMRGMSYQKHFRFSRDDDNPATIFSYWQETLTIAFIKAEGILQQGDKYLDGAAYKNFIIEGRQYIGLLDADGTALNGNGTWTGAGGEDDPVYTVPVYESKPIDWGALALPADLDDVTAVLVWGRRG